MVNYVHRVHHNIYITKPCLRPAEPDYSSMATQVRAAETWLEVGMMHPLEPCNFLLLTGFLVAKQRYHMICVYTS